MYYDNPPMILNNFFQEIKILFNDFDNLYFMCQDFINEERYDLNNHVNNHYEEIQKIFYNNLDKLDLLENLYNNQQISENVLNEIKSDFTEVINNLQYDSGKYALCHIVNSIVDTHI